MVEVWLLLTVTVDAVVVLYVDNTVLKGIEDEGHLVISPITLTPQSMFMTLRN